MTHFPSTLAKNIQTFTAQTVAEIIMSYDIEEDEEDVEYSTDLSDDNKEQRNESAPSTSAEVMFCSPNINLSIN